MQKHREPVGQNFLVYCQVDLGLRRSHKHQCSRNTCYKAGKFSCECFHKFEFSKIKKDLYLFHFSFVVRVDVHKRVDYVFSRLDHTAFYFFGQVVCGQERHVGRDNDVQIYM